MEISVKVKIDLGLFSITLSFSFSATVSAKFVIGSDSTAPWDDQKSLLQRKPALLTAYAGAAAVRRNARTLRPRLKRIQPRVSAAAANPQLKLLASPQFTVLASRRRHQLHSTARGLFFPAGDGRPYRIESGQWK